MNRESLDYHQPLGYDLPRISHGYEHEDWEDNSIDRSSASVPAPPLGLDKSCRTPQVSAVGRGRSSCMQWKMKCVVCGLEVTLLPSVEGCLGRSLSWR